MSLVCATVRSWSIWAATVRPAGRALEALAMSAGCAPEQARLTRFVMPGSDATWIEALAERWQK